jgi:hypothetical protein
MERKPDPTLVRHPTLGQIRKAFPRPPKELIARFARLPTANVSDAMAKAGVMAPELKPLWPGCACAGRPSPVRPSTSR